MSQLIYGRNGQVRFRNEMEKQQAFKYLRESPNVTLVHEDNQEQGAWGPEERIHFKSLDGVPDSLQRNMTAGTGSIAGRINCAELIAEVWGLRSKPGSRFSVNSTSSPVRTGVCCQIRSALGSECLMCGQTVN